MKNIIILISIPLLVACTDSKENHSESMPKTDSVTVVKEKTKPTEETIFIPLNDQFVYLADSVIIPEFEIELKLSDKAEAKLKKEKESVIVQAYFSGIPQDTTLEEYVEWGKVTIGDANIELFDKRIATFENIKIAKENLELLQDNTFEVLINVFTGRRSSNYNLITTDLLQESIDSVKAKRIILNGKLIYGE